MSEVAEVADGGRNRLVQIMVDEVEPGDGAIGARDLRPRAVVRRRRPGSKIRLGPVLFEGEEDGMFSSVDSLGVSMEDVLSEEEDEGEDLEKFLHDSEMSVFGEITEWERRGIE